MTDKESFRLSMENQQLKKQLKKVLAENAKLEYDYFRLADFVTNESRLRDPIRQCDEVIS